MQFTRLPDGLSGALQKIAAHSSGIVGGAICTVIDCPLPPVIGAVTLSA